MYVYNAMHLIILNIQTKLKGVGERNLIKCSNQIK